MLEYCYNLQQTWEADMTSPLRNLQSAAAWTESHWNKGAVYEAGHEEQVNNYTLTDAVTPWSANNPYQIWFPFSVMMPIAYSY